MMEMITLVLAPHSPGFDSAGDGGSAVVTASTGLSWLVGCSSVLSAASPSRVIFGFLEGAATVGTVGINKGW